MLMTDMAEFIGRNVQQVLDKATQRFPGRHVMLLGMRSAGCPEHDTDVRPVAAGARERRGCPRCSTRRTLTLTLILPLTRTRTRARALTRTRTRTRTRTLTLTLTLALTLTRALTRTRTRTLT